MTQLYREDLDSIPHYVPGRRIPGAIKIASNETTASPQQVVVDAVTRATLDANRYPDTTSADVRAAIATALNDDLQKLHPGTDVHYTPDNIVVGNGSVSLLQHLIQAACTGEDAVVMAWRSFEAYPIMTQVANARSVQVPVTDDGKHDLTAMAEAAQRPEVRLVLLCNPNNPTGEIFSTAELTQFLQDVPQDTLVVLDEAYCHYVRHEDYPESLMMLPEHPNLVVLRTFSKAYGLAAMRVGYMVGSTDIAAALSKVVIPFATSGVSQAAAIAALHIREELLGATDEVVVERLRVTRALTDMGFTVIPSQANFVWIPCADATHLTDYLTSQKVLVRGFAGDGVRVTIGSSADNDAFLNAIASYPGI